MLYGSQGHSPSSCKSCIELQMHTICYIFALTMLIQCHTTMITSIQGPSSIVGVPTGTFTCHNGHYFIMITISMSNTRPALGESCGGVKGNSSNCWREGGNHALDTQTIHKYYHTTAYEVSRTEYQALEETQHPMNINILLPGGDGTNGTHLRGKWFRPALLVLELCKYL